VQTLTDLPLDCGGW